MEVEKKPIRLDYDDTNNENLSVSVHKNGATFICIHNVVKCEESERKENNTQSINLTDKNGVNTYITLFLKD